MITTLVTGATGFIGSHLCDALIKKGWRVRAAVRKKSGQAKLPSGVEPVEVGDISASPNWSKALESAEIVFHLAGKAHDTGAMAPDSAYDAINLQGTKKLLAACRKSDVRRLVYFSSIKAMSDRTEGPQDESFPPIPATPYGKSKLDAEREILAASGDGDFTSVCLRLSLVYGPGQKGNLLRLVRQIDRGFFPKLAWIDNRRSLVHIDNVIAAAVLASECPQAAGQTYIVTDREPYSTAAICGLIRDSLGGKTRNWDLHPSLLRSLGFAGDLFEQILGRSLPFDSESYQKLCGNSWYSCEKIVRELGYAPGEDLRTAIPKIIQHYKSKES